jgi:hypothetical protein
VTGGVSGVGFESEGFFDSAGSNQPDDEPGVGGGSWAEATPLASMNDEVKAQTNRGARIMTLRRHVARQTPRCLAMP